MSNDTTLNVNGKKLRVDVDSQTPLLYVLRDHLNLTGTKYGCGEARCGACTVLVDGQMMRSCVTPVAQCVAGGVFESRRAPVWLLHVGHDHVRDGVVE